MSTDFRISRRRAMTAAVLMGVVAVSGQALVPTRKLAALRGDFKLGELVPHTIGPWVTDETAVSGVVNPQATALLDRTYSQILERNYVDSKGRRIMLSIAYGEDQTDVSSQVHYPEVCYPAQGFQVLSNMRHTVQTNAGAVQVRRLQTVFAKTRHEPVTYWTMMGEHQSLGGWQKRLAELRHGLRGEILDGLVFRVSSINPDQEAGFALQEEFIRQVAESLAPGARMQLMGLR